MQVNLSLIRGKMFRILQDTLLPQIDNRAIFKSSDQR